MHLNRQAYVVKRKLKMFVECLTIHIIFIVMTIRFSFPQLLTLTLKRIYYSSFKKRLWTIINGFFTTD